MNLFLLFLIVLAIVPAGSDRQGMVIGDGIAGMHLVDGNNEFALELFSEVCRMQEDGNLYFSPYSISMALGMIYNGASGNTALEIASALHFNLPAEALNRGFSSVGETLYSGSLSGMENEGTCILTISNRLWVQSGYEMLNSFTSALRAYYNASAENLDFAADGEGSTKTINSWVAESTRGEIVDMIPSGMLGVDTRVLLTNATYFSGSWRYPFEKNQTSDGRFLLTDSTSVTVSMMTNTELYSYGTGEGWSAVSLFYAGGSASMLIILPSGSMEEFQENFTPETLINVQSSMLSRYVDLTLPQFEFARSIPLSDILISLGLESIFSSDANFSGFTGSSDLYVSEVLHKTYVRVDEAGTAADTAAVVISKVLMRVPPIEMNINRPFIFIIKDYLTGSILFMGRVMDPSI